MTLSKQDFSLLPVKNALKSLEEALQNHRDDLTRDGCIQRFEYTFELAWKTLRRYFEINNNLQEDNVKNLLREAGKQGLITSVESWFDFHKARNQTSHMYSRKVAEEVFAVAAPFAKACSQLIAKLEKLLA